MVKSTPAINHFSRLTERSLSASTEIGSFRPLPETVNEVLYATFLFSLLFFGASICDIVETPRNNVHASYISRDGCIKIANANIRCHHSAADRTKGNFDKAV